MLAPCVVVLWWPPDYLSISLLLLLQFGRFRREELKMHTDSFQLLSNFEASNLLAPLQLIIYFLITFDLALDE